MIIRKSIRIDSSSHIVLNCSSDRCRKTYHSHSPLVEILIDGSALDNAGMVVDFGLLKNFKKFLNIFNNTLMIWDKDPFKQELLVSLARENKCDICDLRYVILPFNPSAELLSIFYHVAFDRIINQTRFKNNESPDIRIDSVIYHETKSGYAKSDKELVDLFLINIDLSKIIVSKNIINEDKVSDIVSVVRGNKEIYFENPEIELKVKDGKII